jgi:hypothetical protein
MISKREDGDRYDIYFPMLRSVRSFIKHRFDDRAFGHRGYASRQPVHDF